MDGEREREREPQPIQVSKLVPIHNFIKKIFSYIFSFIFHRNNINIQNDSA